MTLHPAFFAAAIVVLAAADDRELVVTWPDGTVMTACAKAPPRGAPDPCEAARAGRWQPAPDAAHHEGYPPIEDATTRCIPHPNCFDPRSECIAGYNCR